MTHDTCINILGVVPTIASLKVAAKDEDKEAVDLSCSWEYRSDGSHVEFNVRWFRDSSDTSHSVEHKINGTASKRSYEHLYERAQVFIHGDTKEYIYGPNGYHWNKEVCIYFLCRAGLRITLQNK